MIKNMRLLLERQDERIEELEQELEEGVFCEEKPQSWSSYLTLQFPIKDVVGKAMAVEARVV
jgi:hypothetical protein